MPSVLGDNSTMASQIIKRASIATVLSTFLRVHLKANYHVAAFVRLHISVVTG